VDNDRAHAYHTGDPEFYPQHQKSKQTNKKFPESAPGHIKVKFKNTKTTLNFKHLQRKRTDDIQQKKNQIDVRLF
jgi:hypothetical protein